MATGKKKWSAAAPARHLECRCMKVRTSNCPVHESPTTISLFPLLVPHECRDLLLAAEVRMFYA